MSDLRDVIVVGGGPAGSTAAALLAERGHDVLVLEKEAFPRFRIGESLLPACVPVIDRLGIEQDADVFVPKAGARFQCEDTGRDQVFAFAEAYEGCPTYAWHVERSGFDVALRDRARALGAEVRHGETVQKLELGEGAVSVETSAGRERARFLLDASGQGRFLARRLDAVRHYESFGLASVYTHYEGLTDEAWEELGPGFEIRIMVRSEGWGWIIPLPKRRLSVGIVGRAKVAERDLDEGLLAGPLMSRLARGARRLATRIVGNFSYGNTSPCGARYGAIGDAACFLDPVFSSGVTLALRGAERAADVLAPALEERREADPELLTEHQAAMDRASRTFYALIHRFYHSNMASSFFLKESVPSDLKRGIMTVLAGHVWRADNPFQDMLLRSRHGELTGAASA